MIKRFFYLEPGMQLCIIVLVLAALCLVYIAWRGLRGDRRAWTVTYYFSGSMNTLGPRLNLPLRATASAVFFLVIAVKVTQAQGILASQAGESASTYALLGSILVVWMAGFWWPSFLGPRWYRQWRARGRRGLALPYSEQEISAVSTLPDGPQKERQLLDIQKSRTALAQLISSRRPA